MSGPFSCTMPRFGAKIFSGRNTGPKFSVRNAILLSEFRPDILAGDKFRPAHESTLKNSSVDKALYLFYTWSVSKR